VDLVRGGRGDFIVVADGVTLWNKKQTGRFPDEAALVTQLRDQAAAE
jgi:predicted Rdx family selenoprotein